MLGDEFRIFFENGGVEQSLEIVVAVFLGDVGWVENFFDGVNRFRGLATGFVVDDADLSVDAVEAVDDAFDGDGLAVNRKFVADGSFHVDDGEGREFLVDFQELFQVADDDSPIDDLEAV